MSAEIPRWMMGDPAKAVERLQESEINRETRIIEGGMGRHLNSISEQIRQDMYRWGEWACRPQYWQNLKVTPFCKLIGLNTSRDPKDFRLDPQSMAIHKAVMSLEYKYQAVLYAYYVAHVAHDDMAELFNARGISRKTYYRAIDAGSVIAHGKAKRWLESAKKLL